MKGTGAIHLLCCNSRLFVFVYLLRILTGSREPVICTIDYIRVYEKSTIQSIAYRLICVNNTFSPTYMAPDNRHIEKVETNVKYRPPWALDNEHPSLNVILIWYVCVYVYAQLAEKIGSVSAMSDPHCTNKGRM